MQASQQLYPDHCRARQLISSGALPSQFNNFQFVSLIAKAIHECLAAVNGEREVRRTNVHQGVIIRRRKGGTYYIATSPPVSDVRNLVEQRPSSFGGALQSIEYADALVIGAPTFFRDLTITGAMEANTYKWLAASLGAPVIVKSVRSKTWVFTQTGQVIEYPWRCQ